MLGRLSAQEIPSQNQDRNLSRILLVGMTTGAIIFAHSHEAAADNLDSPHITVTIPGSEQVQEIEGGETLEIQADKDEASDTSPPEITITNSLPGSKKEADEATADTEETEEDIDNGSNDAEKDNNPDRSNDRSSEEPNPSEPAITNSLPGSVHPAEVENDEENEPSDDTDTLDSELPTPSRPEESEAPANGDESVDPNRNGQAGPSPSQTNEMVGDIEYFNQHDPEWADHRFDGGSGTGNMDKNGCGPTALAMAISSLSEKDVTPVEVAHRLMELGIDGVTFEGSTVHKGLAIIAEEYGLRVEFFKNPDVLSDIQRTIENGGVVITNGTDPGEVDNPNTPATTGGHIFGIRRVESGQMYLFDPNSRPNSSKPFTPDQIFPQSTMALEILPAAPVESAPPVPRGFETVADPEAERDNIYKNHSQNLTNIQIEKNSEYQTALDAFIRHYQENKQRYMAIAEQTNLPAPLIAALHWRESSGNFNAYMHNGDPLGEPTVNVPAGIYFDNFESSAVDALDAKESFQNKYNLYKDSKDLAAMSSYAEHYNGLGYHNKGVASPYVYSGTNIYQSGKYVADGVYDPSVKDKQIGVLLMISAVRNL